MNRASLTEVLNRNVAVTAMRGSVRQFVAGNMIVSLHHFTSGGTAPVDLSPAVPHLVIAFPLNRRMVLTPARGERYVVPTNTPFFFRSEAAFSATAKAGLHLLTVSFPLDDIIAMGVENIPSAGRIPRTSRLVGPLRAFFRQLPLGRQEGSSLSTYALETLGREMVAALLMRRGGITEQLQGMRPSVFDEAQSLIASRREDPALTPSTLAQDLNISLRQLQRAFAAHHTTPRHEIRTRRTSLALSLLRDPSYDSLTISSVAHYSGFTSTADMRRALTADTGFSPQALRRHRGTPPVGDTVDITRS